MPELWSRSIAERYRCELSPELVDWFDGEHWRRTGGGEFRQAVSPEELIEPAPEAIRPGMMPSDLLPVISNTVGDWLCIRFDQDSRASQIVHWYHGGGDWIPWGDNLAHALAFDAVVHRFPSHSRPHASRAEPPRPSASQRSARDPFLAWASGHLSPKTCQAVTAANDGDLDPASIAERFLIDSVAEIAVRCELTVSALVRDNDDWVMAAQHALPVTRSDGYLAWAWDTVGRSAKQLGDFAAAIAAFDQSVACSSFTDQSVRLGTYATNQRAAKVAAAELHELDPEAVAKSTYLSLLCAADVSVRTTGVTQHWLEIAGGSEDPHQRYHAAVAAGWDVGAAPMSAYRDILEFIADAAQSSGQTARAEMARTHRRCLRLRFGI